MVHLERNNAIKGASKKTNACPVRRPFSFDDIDNGNGIDINDIDDGSPRSDGYLC